MPFISLQDEKYPHLVFINDNRPYTWDSGFLYSLWLRSALLRVSSRGVQEVAGMPRLGVLEAGGWQQAQCLPTAGALCNFSVGGALGPAHTPATNMLLFPTGVVDVPDNFYKLTEHGHAFLEHFNNSSPCTYAASHREIVTSDTRYEVSLCDLLNANLDFVLTKDRVFWRQDGTTTAEYVLFSLLGIILVSQLTSNIMHIMKHQSKSSHGKHDPRRETMAATGHPTLYALFLLAMTLFLTIRTWSEATAYIVTREDRAVALALTLFTWTQYIQHYALVLWTGLLSLRSWSQRDDAQAQPTYSLLGPEFATPGGGDQHDDQPYTDHSFSLLIALLLLLILQVYFTTDTPYSTVMVTLFLARSGHKVLQASATHTPSEFNARPLPRDPMPRGLLSLLLSAFAIFSRLLDLFTAVVLLRGLALVQQNLVHMQLHVLCVVVVALLLSMSMLRLETAIQEGAPVDASAPCPPTCRA
jgi:hypothetical protein